MNKWHNQIKALLFVTVLPFDIGAVEKDLNLDCVIEPYETAEISSQVRGVLEHVYVNRGDIVKKDQVLAKLISNVEETSVNLSRAKADSNIDIMAKHAKNELSQRTYERVKGLHDRKLISTLEKDEAETTKLVAEFDEKQSHFEKRLSGLELEQAIEVLKLRTLKSPFNGLVVKRYKSPGEYVEEDPILKIVQNDPLRVEVIAPLSMFGQITPEMKAIVKPEQPIGGEYVAQVTIVDQVVDPASATFGIRLQLDNPDYKIPSGLRCDIKFIEGGG